MLGDVVASLHLVDGPVMQVPTAVKARWRSDGLLQLAAPAAADVGPSAGGRMTNGSTGDLRTATELLLGEQWSRLLGVSVISRQDNFFELGGTSLLAMQAINDVEKAIGRRVSAQRYPYETLAQIAAMYDAGVVTPQAASAANVVREPRGMLRRIVGFVRGH